MPILLALLYAFLAAIGNAMYVAAQKKATGSANPFAIVVVTSAVCLVLVYAVMPLMGRGSYSEVLRERSIWGVIGGVGLFFVYVGFNLLFTRYDSSSYVLYAVLSIVTTTLGVGAFMFHERLNIYHWLAMGAAMATIALYALGQWHAEK
jgi:drug/metabolite transporter (DMT)-like permease